MKLIHKVITLLLCFSTLLAMTGCSFLFTEDDNSDISFSILSDDVVPKKDTLIHNLKEAGYTITEYSSIDGSSLVIDRVIAEKENKFIDITYGLSSEDSGDIFSLYCDLYEDSDYYILALNLDFVYCVTDKKTFSKAGFTSTSNIGIQYIND